MRMVESELKRQRVAVLMRAITSALNLDPKVEQDPKQNGEPTSTTTATASCIHDYEDVNYHRDPVDANRNNYTVAPQVFKPFPCHLPPLKDSVIQYIKTELAKINF